MGKSLSLVFWSKEKLCWCIEPLFHFVSNFKQKISQKGKVRLTARKLIVLRIILPIFIGFWDQKMYVEYLTLNFFKTFCLIKNRTDILFILTELTEISWYEWFIIAIRRLRSTIILMIEKLPNITNPQNRVNSLMPANSKLSRSIKPNEAQNKVWVVSHKLKN